MTDPDTFRQRWNSYVDDLDRLKLSLPEEEAEELDRIKSDLRDLIDVGADSK